MFQVVVSNAMMMIMMVALLATTALADTSTSTSTATPLKVFQVYHSMNPTSPSSFTKRGTIHLINSDNGGIEVSIENMEDCLDIDIVNEQLIKEDNFYQIKIVDEEEGGSGTGRSVLASVPSCEVRRANFREEISLTVSHTGSLLSISYKPLVSPLASSCKDLPPLQLSTTTPTTTTPPSFKTIITYSTSVTGMVIPTVLPNIKPPPGLQWLPRSSSSTSGNPTVGGGGKDGDGNGNGSGGSGSGGYNPEEEEARKARENQSFFRKYWYIIVPLVISTIFNGEDPQQKQQQQRGGGNGGGGGGQQQQQQGSGGASTVSASASQRQRRSKRG